jgi:O-antigen ligase
MNGVPPWVFALALMFYGIFTSQLVRSLNIDAFQLSGTRVDILGFWVAVLISCVLGLRALMYRYFNLPALLLVLTLIGYVSIVFALTDVRTPFEAFLISRHGILMWFVLGVGVASSINAFAQLQDREWDRRVRILIIGIMLATVIAVIETALDYISDPLPTENYQPAAATGITILIFNFLVSKAAWNNGVPSYVNGMLLAGAAFLIGSIALMQSTLIVLFGVLFVLLLLYGIIRDAKYRKIAAALAIIGLVVLGYLYGDVAESILVRTRFSELMGVEKGFSPLDNRLNLLSTFFDQFEVSPVFGHFNAENISYSGEGFYIHSIPLSFLTHSGIVGFIFFLIVLTMMLLPRLRRWKMISDMERSVFWIFTIVLAIGTVATFFTWPVFWLMLGITAMKPVHRIGKLPS